MLFRVVWFVVLSFEGVSMNFSVLTKPIHQLRYFLFQGYTKWHAIETLNLILMSMKNIDQDPLDSTFLQKHCPYKISSNLCSNMKTNHRFLIQKNQL